MRAVSTGGGAVMFVADEVERATVSISYKDLVRGEEKQTFVSRIFGSRKKTEKTIRKAA